MTHRPKILILTYLTLVVVVPLNAATFRSTATFAGWIKSSTGTVVIQSGTSAKATRLSATQAYAYQLFSGQVIKVSGAGNANLLLYGHPIVISMANGWYPIPDSPAKALPGKDVYAAYTSRAGLARGEGVRAENIWLAESLINLENPDRRVRARIQARIIPITATGAPRRDAPMLNGRYHLKSGDMVAVELKNESDTSVYITLMDIDPSGTVERLSPQTSPGQYPMPAMGKWARLPFGFTLALPDGWSEGIEVFKLIASTRPIDLSILETRNLTLSRSVVPPTQNPLVNLVRSASKGSVTLDTGAWNVSRVDFYVKNQ